MNVKETRKRTISLILTTLITLSLFLYTTTTAKAAEYSTIIGANDVIEPNSSEKTWDWIIKKIKNTDSEYVSHRVSYLLNDAEYTPDNTFTSERYIFDTETEREFDVAAWECKGFARYAFYKIWGYTGFDFGYGDVEELFTVSSAIAKNDMKTAISGLKAGANIRTNEFTITGTDGKPMSIQHSMLFLTVDADNTGFYFIDCNGNSDMRVCVRHCTYDSFANKYNTGLESITTPNQRMISGNYTITAPSGLEYRTSPASTETAGIIPNGTQLTVTGYDSEFSNKTPILVYESGASGRIILRAVMVKTSYNAQTIWVAVNTPNALEYSGPLEDTAFAATEANSTPSFFQRIGNFFKSVWNGIASAVSALIHPKAANAAEPTGDVTVSNPVPEAKDDMTSRMCQALATKWPIDLLGKTYDEFKELYGNPIKLYADIEYPRNFYFDGLGFSVDFDCDIRERVLNSDGSFSGLTLTDGDEISARMDHTAICTELQFVPMSEVFNALNEGFIPDEELCGDLSYDDLYGDCYYYDYGSISIEILTAPDGLIQNDSTIIYTINNVESIADGFYPVYVTGAFERNGEYYLNLITMARYDVIWEYSDSVVVSDDSGYYWDMEEYYYNNYPILEYKNGEVRQINIQDLPGILNMTDDSFMEQISDFSGENDYVTLFMIFNDEKQYQINNNCLIEVSGAPLLKQEEVPGSNIQNPIILSAKELVDRINIYFQNNGTGEYFGSTTIEIKDGMIIHLVETYSIAWG